MKPGAVALGLLLLGFVPFLAVQGPGIQGPIYKKRDFSTNDLSQWTHLDYGLGTDVGGNDSGAGHLWYHSNVAGRPAAGLTVTPTAHASPAANSDSVYLWEPSQYWNHAPYEIWLRTSVLFPSAATISAVGAAGEQPFRPTTGEWNWFLEFHNDSNSQPPCTKEYANVAMDVKTDDLVQSGVVGTQNVRMAVRVMGGDGCAPKTVWVDGSLCSGTTGMNYSCISNGTPLAAPSNGMWTTSICRTTRIRTSRRCIPARWGMRAPAIPRLH